MRKVGLAIYLIMLFASFALNIYQYRQRNNDVYDSDTISTTIIDTITYHQPSPIEEKPLGNITAKLPVSVPKLPESVQKIPESDKNLQDSVQNFGKNVPDDKEDNFLIKDHSEDMGEMFTPDSVAVSIPISQTVYEDSTYTAYISGYHVNLDSVILHIPKVTTIVTQHKKKKRWGIGVHAGYGFTLKGTPQWSPYIGIGISYNIFSF